MALTRLMLEQNFPAICIHRGMAQEDRLNRYQAFKEFQKVLIVVYFMLSSYNKVLTSKKKKKKI